MATSLTPMLMFTGAANEAMQFYVSLFNDSAILDVELYGPGEPGAAGSVKKAAFRVCGQDLLCIDSPMSPDFGFTPSISLCVECADEEELGRAFESLADGGSVLMPLDDYGFSKQFGWLNDRFGVSWQLNLK